MVYFLIATKLLGKDDNATWEKIRMNVFGKTQGSA